ncbi:beta strand repeat-containing protein [Leadbettera azotonutricia]|uniref:Putative lipoprotein n=1 Tax=Leadbettera azotonutricia (strain ATCC BAA-888 / DSM 13862 / ZAS-9) TaxID=545695 RepID=F5YES2_LEAAZ|nr:hypothetical protein [Leadbettera azotonutricia]AEF81909.1 putative lipoprotein [Leadbettera azotonutricia ZAS-9]
MKKFVKVLAFAGILVALALFVAGCSSSSDDNGTTSDPTAVTAALLSHFNSAPITIGRTSTFTAPRLTSVAGANTLVQGINITQVLAYVAKTGDGETLVPPYITYTLAGNNPTTFDPVTFTQDEGDKIAVAIQSKLSGSFASNHADTTTDGYAYFDTVTATITEFPDAGRLVVKITLAKDAVADAAKVAIVSPTALTIDASLTEVFGYAAVYTTASKTLAITVSAAGVSKGGAEGIASAIAAALTITNDIDAGYTVEDSISGVVNGSNVIVSIKLAQAPITAAAVSGAISPADVNGSLGISDGGVVTSAVINALGAIANSTKAADATYNSASHSVNITVTPAVGVFFSTTEGFYNTVVTALRTKFTAGTTFITNGTDPAYVVFTDISYAVSGGNLVFTVSLINYVQPHLIVTALNSVGNASGATIADATSVTSGIIVGLSNISGATAGVSAVYNSTRHSFTISVEPEAGYIFNPNLVTSGSSVVSAYATVNTEVTSKLGTAVVNQVDSTYQTVMTPIIIEVAGGKLVFTVQLRQSYVDANTIIAALGSAASGAEVVNAASVTGDVIDLLAGIANATEIVTTAYGDHSIVITIVPAGGYSFNPTPGIYSAVGTTVDSKIGATVINAIDENYTIIGTSVVSMPTGMDLVVTIPLGRLLGTSVLENAIGGAASGDIYMSISPYFGTTITGDVITALSEFAEIGTVTSGFANPRLTITVSPAAGYLLNRAPGFYDSVADALASKLSEATIVNDDTKGAIINLQANTVTAAFVGGNLELRVDTISKP